MNSFAVILVAGGRGSRFRSGPRGLDRDVTDKKPFTLLKGRAVWLHAAQKFANHHSVRQIILVVPPDDQEEIDRRFSADISFMAIETVPGGQVRYQSVENALKHVRDDIDFVAIHDSVRPCVTPEAIDRVFDAAIKFGAALLAAPVVDTLKRTVSEQREEKTELDRLQESFGLTPSGTKSKTVRSFVTGTVDRTELWEAQTPQVFRRDWLLDAFRLRKDDVTDDCQLIEQLGKKVVVVPSDRTNIKITTQTDLLLAEKYLEILSRKTKSAFDHFR